MKHMIESTQSEKGSPSKLSSEEMDSLSTPEKLNCAPCKIPNNDSEAESPRKVDVSFAQLALNDKVESSPDHMKDKDRGNIFVLLLRKKYTAEKTRLAAHFIPFALKAVRIL